MVGKRFLLLRVYTAGYEITTKRSRASLVLVAGQQNRTIEAKRSLSHNDDRLLMASDPKGLTDEWPSFACSRLTSHESLSFPGAEGWMTARHRTAALSLPSTRYSLSVAQGPHAHAVRSCSCW